MSFFIGVREGLRAPFFFLFLFLILEMTKEEVKNGLLESGLINRFKPSPLWSQAFNLYNAHKGSSLKPTCGTCFKKVKEWILRTQS